MNKNDKNGNQKNRIKIIISPAKKMKETDVLPPESTPVFLPRTEHLLSYMKKMSLPQLQAVWKCNDKLAQENFERIAGMDLRERLSPAILTYEGIQYKYMAPAVFDEEAYAYLQEHLYRTGTFICAGTCEDFVRILWGAASSGRSHALPAGDAGAVRAAGAGFSV